MAKKYPIEWLYHILFIHSSVNVLFKLFYLLAMINNAAIKYLCTSFCVKYFLMGIYLGVELLGNIFTSLFCSSDFLFTWFLDSLVDRYVFVVHNFYLYLFLLPLLKEYLSAFHIILVWWWWTPLAFSYLWSSLSDLQFWMIALLGRVILVVGSCYSSLWIFLATPFWPA